MKAVTDCKPPHIIMTFHERNLMVEISSMYLDAIAVDTGIANDIPD
ncbi:hypothetical protein J8J04_02425 ['Fragaria x ananassa' phyllody phytoplasma]|uniref:Uncharacterized protein n=1 Tax='Fragaria x ananassa' phyllody phytoplasma TaxID=2358428 RepID=A0ABS5K3P3_9MOLU|nr:hypothetical protein ['Fragaria x ananassa' phyllody phytoplasma]MBS2126532.1 hypothetical protein ['Fragaria x ananassa' phyllody phytoplasma]